MGDAYEGGSLAVLILFVAAVFVSRGFVWLGVLKKSEINTFSRVAGVIGGLAYFVLLSDNVNTAPGYIALIVFAGLVGLIFYGVFLMASGFVTDDN